MNPGREPGRNGRTLRTLATLSVVGLTLALSIGVGIGIGLLLDRWFGTNWLVIVFTILGAIAGFRQLIQAVIRAGREQEAADAARRREADRDSEEEGG